MSDAAPRKKPIPQPIARPTVRRDLTASRARSVLPSVAFLAAALAATPILGACGQSHHEDELSIVAERQVHAKAPATDSATTDPTTAPTTTATVVPTAPTGTIGGNPEMIEVTATPTVAVPPKPKPPKPPIVPTTHPPPMPGGIGMVKPPPPMPTTPPMAGGIKPTHPTT